MNYEEKYKKAVQQIRDLLERSKENGWLQMLAFEKDFEQIFPELKESEDEKTKLTAFEEEVKDMMNDYRDAIDDNPVTTEEVKERAAYMLSLIPKKSTWSEEDEKNLQGIICEIQANKNSAPSYDIPIYEEYLTWLKSLKDRFGCEANCTTTKERKPKFHERDWVILTAGELSTTLQVVNVDANKELYWFNDGSYLPIVDEECLRQWTIQDVKDGDVLAGSDVVLMFRGIGNARWDDVIDYYCRYCYYGNAFTIQEDLEYWGNIKNNQLQPATKEQQDLLFQKMREAGYEWDGQSKRLSHNR